MKYRVTIAESLYYKQFVGEIEAESEVQAKEKAMQIFKQEYAQYMYHCRVIMCIPILNNVKF